MLTRRVIPCLDVDAGRVVKGVRFANLRDAGDPAGLAARYESQGADEIVLLDVTATRQGRNARSQTIAAVRTAISIPLTVGGGVRTLDDALSLLDHGADRVAVNTAAVRSPDLLDALANRFGRQCVTIAIDAAVCLATSDQPEWEVLVSSGRERTGMDGIAWAQEATDRGAGEVLLTSWDRDGTREGYDLKLIATVSRAIQVPLIASGGAAKSMHMADAIHAGADAVLAASIFHDGVESIAQIKQSLAAAGFEMRIT